jgi:murein DD-endopeptidase MepM/ murein hydrolase activator NlpD
MRERQPKITKNSKTRIHPTMAKTENPATRSAVLESQQATELPLQGVITSTTGYRNDPFDGRLKHHNGMDIAAPSGTPVKPVASGIVVYSGWRNGYGNSVIIEHDNGMVTVYAHHSSNQVSEGTAVDRSTVIALSGSTGRSTGPHLHFEAWRNGENITPSFLPTGTPQQHQAVAATAVRRYLQPDGTILFTNLR